MEYATWIGVRSDYALLLEDIANGQSVGFPRDYAMIFTRPYHEYLDCDGLETGSLLMILCMALSDIVGHQDAFPLIHDPECAAAVNGFRSPDRSMTRLAETVATALDVISETDFHSRETHRKYEHLQSMLPWVREHIILDHFRRLASGNNIEPNDG
ncbi:hypothetical protein LF1_53190 [Rubripirellula obstinata]|uniref:Uncharacterized protein n=1 Tax=Rubripirellula obstinata TaxID=406547 RepID=A0A5B1CCY5_9BACT|nr:hypothetical protein [Rubripirellula obstinata]KAA1257470.1 hypothetical protein LF1_53190 [Rubripirellula obstinata]